MFKRKTEKEFDPHQLKTDDFNFSLIANYFLESTKEGPLQTISEQTSKDLDLQDVFRYIDRTVSCVGQQYLYNQLLTIPGTSQRTDRQEYLIQAFKSNPELKASVVHHLEGLTRRDAYYISSLIFGKYLVKPQWFWLVYTLSLLSAATVLLSFVFPKALLLLLVLLPINFGIHYWNKNNQYQYGSSIPQLLKLTRSAKELSNFTELENTRLKTSILQLDKLGISMSLFKIEAKLQSEIGQIVEYLIELVKALFLIEPIILFRTLEILDSRRKQMLEVFDFVGQLDSALSITWLRESADCCLPVLSPDKKVIEITDAYHPLIYNGVANSISIHQKSVVLTGSNMSGKTTFIRTIGVNALLAQTINTCFAKTFTLPRMKIHSAIRISDDLLNEKSYYFEEVLTIKQLLEEVKNGSENLFLLDELFKGTNTIERIASGKAILSYLNQGSNIVFISTHDREMADYLHDSYDLYHFTEMIKDDEIAFDYKIKTGPLTTTNAIRILELNDFPSELIREARDISSQMLAKNNQNNLE